MELDNILWVLLGLVVTVAAVIVFLNLRQGEKKLEHPFEHEYGVRDEQFMRSMGGLLQPPILDGNRIEPLYNGDQIFPAMLDAIRSAQKTITFETFIYWEGKIGEAFAEALSERARAGVKVHVLLDWVGSKKMDQRYLEQMEGAGVEVERYHPIRWYTLTRMNNRTHRKLLVVDGRLGFTGGVGIADEWMGNAQDECHWRDTHYKLEGPAVAEMQRSFIDNWLKTKATVLHTEDYFPRLEPAGSCLAQMFQSSRDEGSESVRLMYLLSIAAAEQSIKLASAYFVPDDLAVEMLVRAQRRGVRVEIVVPGPCIDAPLVRRASRARWGRLLEAGVEICEFQPTMFHVKLMIVDGVWVSVGSTNFDTRSFRLNDEANLNIYDADLAQRESETFERDKARSRRITLEEWKRRPLKEKVIEHLSALLRSQL